MARGDLVSVPESVITDIAALKSSQGEMQRSMERTSEQLAHINGRLEGFSEILQTIARIAEKQESHENGLKRAFTAIGKVEDDLDAHEAENLQVEKKLTLWQGIAIGISVMASCLAGMFVWVGNDVITTMRDDIKTIQEKNENKNDRDDQRLDRLERIEARHHGEQ